MGKIPASELLMLELVRLGCDRDRAKYLMEETKKEWREKNRRREFLFSAKTKREKSAREIQNEKLAAYLADIDAAYGQNQPTNGSPLGTPIAGLISANSGTGDHQRDAESPHAGVHSISGKRTERDRQSPFWDAKFL